ncbi:MAG: 50S ribosomal protein L11 [Alphaproteobacteria bacterium]|jgi:large subunit ribosomal protein L11
MSTVAKPKKEVVKLIKLQIQAGKANPAPPVGPALGQAGVNIMEFCKQFNDKTKDKKGPLPVIIQVYKDKSFDFKTKLPPVSYLIKESIGLASGSKTPGLQKAGKISLAQIKKIAETKMQDLNAVSIEGAMNMIKGSARSMGLEVTE